MYALCGTAMRKRITDRMNVEEMSSDSLIFYYVFLFFLFVRDLVTEDKNLEEVAGDFVEEDTIFKIVFLIFGMRLISLIVLTLGVVELSLGFLDGED